ncbi:hypothetical protein AUEXF2481DRAFT_695687 [Aureobasidium subglaciale EXF-2481]|uniref:Uncharacterized protein n=1 Tax=Aureobasidium subglaciale (strain EXF-2481) TaxID=1043005 RepID=A0A074YWI3_AURSE|nr:uncharacterized protein AUEXF2481DRAFT_695687 [Aureobasidium subglaciale EXF-2481]KER00505.1 hypothetical protein AUEXF2481DRAFT_695687 [Aureobasidium subglaciale EXF-2481]
MAAATSNKRQRIDPPMQYQNHLPFGHTHTISQPPSFSNLALVPYPQRTPAETLSIITMVTKLDETSLRNLLIQSAISHDHIYTSHSNTTQALDFVARKLAKENATVQEFEKNVDQVHHVINVKWEKLSDAKQYNKAWDATELVNKEIAKIVNAIKEQSHQESRVNAIVALCEIGGIVAVGGDRLGAEVRKHVGCNDQLVESFWSVLATMSQEEVRKVAMSEEDFSIMEAFDKERKGYCVFDGFDEIIEHFKNSAACKDGHDEDGEEDDEYGDVDEQALINTSDAIEGSASQPIAVWFIHMLYITTTS